MRPVDEEEKIKGLREAFFHFDIFKELYDKYIGRKLPPQAILENILTREYGISDVSKKEACSVFVDSIKFIDLAHESEDGSLICSERTIEQPVAEPEQRPKTVSHGIDQRLVDLITKIGSLKAICELGDNVIGEERGQFKDKCAKIVEESYALASDIGLAVTKMSLKIMKDRLGKEKGSDLLTYYSYIEDGLKEDLGLVKSDGGSDGTG